MLCQFPAQNVQVSLPLGAKWSNLQLVTPGTLNGSTLGWTLTTLAADDAYFMSLYHELSMATLARAVDGLKNMPGRNN